MHISGEDSSYRKIKHGVPQGSVLESILFLLYINDLSNAIVYSLVYNFADDTAILCSEKDPKLDCRLASVGILGKMHRGYDIIV